MVTPLFNDVYRGRRVLVTGHTGFKGSWLTAWLLELGAHITGFSDAVLPKPGLFSSLGLESKITHVIGDVRDAACLRQAYENCRPEVVFHLAAQSLVRTSYRQPAETFATNVLGTVNLLEAARLANQPAAIVVVTSDKCYENREWLFGYREEDPLGGHDPYSASKGCAELVVNSYRRAFFAQPHAGQSIGLASARAGNVIGGGDWAEDRIVPDCIRALAQSQPIRLRKPHATRPWQHVLEPLSGYLWLGSLLWRQVADSRGQGAPAGLAGWNQLCGAFNFGPATDANRSVAQLVAEILKHWPGAWESVAHPEDPHEAGLLHLAIDKAAHCLQWQPVWNFESAVAGTARWYREVCQSRATSAAATAGDIAAYVRDARARKMAWAAG